MCCCGKPTINGEIGAYSWDGKTFGTHPPNPPALIDGDELLHDLPGRCGGADSHSHHFRIVKQRYGGFALLVRHGGGDERLPLGRDDKLIAPLATMDDAGRYWFVMRLHYVVGDAKRAAVEKADASWRTAAAEKRIKVRKLRGRDAVHVSISARTEVSQP